MTTQAKIALITGAGSGVGRACALALAKEGYEVIVTGRRLSALEETVTAAKGLKGHIHAMAADITDPAQVQTLFADVKKKFGRLDVLFNNAGIGIGGLVTEMSLETWRRQQSINVEGVFLGVKHCLPLMREGGGKGSIINMSSVAGLKGSAGMSSYCATKGAVRLFTKSVALECAAAGDGIRCNSVHPGIIDTPIWDSIGETLPVAGQAPGANRPDLDALTAMGAPLARPGAPSEIAEGVLYLASDQSSYVTGSELVIDGGWVTR
jgi:NAD(P)-dependent dehydrogenase (short-subunit alcohol dehydrogenase family)